MWWPCPLCRRPRPVQQTKKHKPYLICDTCGVQMFVRYVDGIRRLDHAATERRTSGNGPDAVDGASQ